MLAVVAPAAPASASAPHLAVAPVALACFGRTLATHTQVVVDLESQDPREVLAVAAVEQILHTMMAVADHQEPAVVDKELFTEVHLVFTQGPEVLA